GRVTTRAVAQRAGLPLGAVSYHFRGKQELLTPAALATVEAAFPTGGLAAVNSLAELIDLMTRAIGDRHSETAVLSGVLVETLREAGRDPALAERMTGLLAEYRRLLGDLVRAEQQRGRLRDDVDPAALAILLAAVGDGLLLHALLDRHLETDDAFETLRGLLER